MRKCDKCGSRMAPFLPRTRLEDGSLVCKGCANRNDTPAPKQGARERAGWAPNEYGDEGAENYEQEGVGEGRIFPIYDEDSDVHRPSTWEAKWEWEAFTYDGLPTRHSGTAQSHEEARAAVEEVVNGGQMSLFGARKQATVPDHYRVLVLDQGEEVPIVVWSGHNPSECMTKAMEEHADPESVHVYIERLRGAMGRYEVIWRDGEQTEHFASKEAAEEDRSAVYVVNVPGQEGFHPTIQWDDSFGKWVCSGEGGRYATGSSPQVVLRTIKGRFGSGTTIEKKTGSRKVAHDSGDGETIFHCPFCGAGQVVARSDGTAECGFCQTAFTVQVQPNMAAVPQTIDGVPHVHPDMPGSDPGTAPDETAPEEQAVETPLTQQEQQDQGGIFASRRYFLTDSSVALPEDAYIRHLAIKHADDRQAVIAAVRAERQDRG